MDKAESVERASLHLVRHFSDCLERGGEGLHSRVFSYFLHPEENFVGAGQSERVLAGDPSHPEHAVPCAYMIEEACRLLKEGRPERDISSMLAKHWKIVRLAKSEASHLDSKDGLNIKDTMPPGWRFEEGDTFARIAKLDIEIVPCG